MPDTIEMLTAKYLKLRNYRDTVRDEQKAIMGQINAKVMEVETEIQRLMQEQGLKSAPNQYGTPYISVANSFPVQDWEAFMDFVKENNLYHMLERRVSKSAIEEFSEGHGGNVPPGLGRKAVVNVRVRKAGSKVA